MSLLKIENIKSFYGNICVLKGISLKVNKGEIVCLIGSNGAGKTTTLKTICGILQARQGSIIFNEEEITRFPPHTIVNRGIAMVPEGRKVFSKLTVLENLEIGAYLNKNQKEVKNDIEQMFTLFPRLSERHKQYAGTLSGGEQQMLAIARALMARPKLLLLDEPSMGLAPILLENIFNKIKEINKQGTTILLVEQNTLMALSIAHYGFVLQTGKIVLEGKADEMMQNPMVIEAYLGG